MSRPTGFEAWLGRRASRSPALVARLAAIESSFYREPLDDIAIDRPIFVVGLARAGTTILLELLARHPQTASHRYRDYPLAALPVWWNRFQSFVPRIPIAASERPHGDGILITPDSPEAMEEPLWMAYFPHAHDPARSSVLSRDVASPAFEAAYRDHLRKILMVRGGARYLAKGNYNLTRLPYLARLFPDARFVVAVRSPEAHVASLIRQHERFCALGRSDPGAVEHMRQVGHFEFGLDRRPVHCGDDAATRSVLQAWADGDEILGWSRYWADIHRYLADLLATDRGVAAATLVLRHEDLVGDPHAAMRSLHAHCALPIDAAAIESLADAVGAREAGGTTLEPSARAAIKRETAAPAASFGY